MNYVSVTNPRWGDAAKTWIDCTVVFELAPAIPGRDAIPAVLPTAEIPATETSLAVPATPGTPEVPAVPETPAKLSDPWAFGAHPDSSDSHSQDIYAECVAGKYGPIADYVAPPPVVPATVALWQAKAALSQAALLDKANTAIAGMNNDVLNHFWATAATIDRASPTLASLGTQLGLSSAQMDQLFITAQTISL